MRKLCQSIAILPFFFQTIPITPPPPAPVLEVLIPAPDKLDVWISKLESRENCPPQGLIDSNGLKSYGPLCWQEATFRGFVKRYDLLKDSEPAEIMNWISDKTFGRELIKKMLEDNYENYDHWRNSVKKIGFPPRIGSYNP